MIGANREMPNINTHTDSPPSRPTRLVVSVVVAVCVVFTGMLFVLARQSDWTLGRIYVVLFATHLIVHVACLLTWNPVLLVRRYGAGTKAWDLVLTVMFLPIFIAAVVIAVRDLNTRHGDPNPPGIAWLIGLCIFVFGWTLINSSMAVNPFFEKLVRIQTDRGHHVIDRGPYAYIRHPGYVGTIAVLLSTPILLASAWFFLVALIGVVQFVSVRSFHGGGGSG